MNRHEIAYYYLVPIVFWLFGPLYMVAATVILVFVLLPKIDKTPIQFRQGGLDAGSQ